MAAFPGGAVPADLKARVLAAADAAAARPPDARGKIHVEGTLPHQGIYDESLASLQDMEAMRDLGLGWRLTGKPDYARACGSYYGAWLAHYHPGFNPIDETRFDNFLIGYDLAAGALGPGLWDKMRAFEKGMAEGYLAGKNITMEGTRTNNWQSHRVKLAALASFALGDEALIARSREAYQKQLGVNLEADGAVLDFKERDALHYTVYDLEPLAVAALAAKAHGQDWYHLTGASGASLEKALEWLAPYAEGKKTHLEFVHSTIAFDAQRRAAGVEGFGGAWEPGGAAYLYALAARLDPRWEPLSRQLGGAPDWLECLMPLPGK
ncbi:MAG TPA: alginate lyase family protein [bacterium]|nr:alginate lyase family protein [bacterium]